MALDQNNVLRKMEIGGELYLIFEEKYNHALYSLYKL